MYNNKRLIFKNSYNIFPKHVIWLVALDFRIDIYHYLHNYMYVYIIILITNMKVFL